LLTAQPFDPADSPREHHYYYYYIRCTGFTVGSLVTNCNN